MRRKTNLKNTQKIHKNIIGGVELYTICGLKSETHNYFIINKYFIIFIPLSYLFTGTIAFLILLGFNVTNTQ